MPVRKFDWLSFIKEHQALLVFFLIIMGVLSLRVGSVQVSYIDINLQPPREPQVESTPQDESKHILEENNPLERLAEPLELKFTERASEKSIPLETSPTPEQITPIVLTQITANGDPYERYK